MSGQLVSTQALCFTVSKLVFGVAADRESPLRILSFGLALVALSSACFGMVSSFYQILFTAACIGGLQGASWVPATKLLAKWYTDSSYGRMFSILGCGSTTAGLLIPLITTLYWRKFMICSGVIMSIYCLVLLYILRNDDVEPPLPSNSEKSPKLLSLTYSPAIWNVAVFYLFTMEIRTVCESWIPLYITKNGISLPTFQISYELGGVLGNIGSGALLDYLSIQISVDAARRIIGLGSTTLLLIIVAFSMEYMEHVAVVGGLLGLFVNSSINIWCLIASQLGDSRLSGTIAAYVSFLANFGSVLAGSPMAFLINSFGYSCFTPLFITHIAVLGAISSLHVEFRVK